MRWIVMARSKAFMTINYAVMIEVQKTLTGYRFKLQYDSRALGAGQGDAALALFDDIMGAMVKPGATVRDLLSVPSDLAGTWHAAKN
jgi:hypothetical protein